MNRRGWLFPLALGALVACDAARSTAPDPVADPSAILDLTGVDIDVVVDVQPIGDVQKAVVQLAKSHVTVAVLAPEGFDVLRIDPASVVFAGATEIHVEGTSEGCTYDAGHYRLVDGDERTDAVFHFAPDALDFDRVDTEGWCLSGVLEDGTTFGGCETAEVRVK